MKDKERRNRLEHYINQTREMDKFVGDLVHALSYYNEKTIVVFYGDHLPSLDIERQELDNDSIYETEYVIWSNYSMKQKNKDYAAYQLGAMVLKQAGITTGNIVKLHQTYMDEKDYQKDLKLLQYDQLYGKNYLYRDEEVFPVMDMQFGVAPLKIKQVKIRSAITIVKGREFTPYTRLFINDERVPTKYLNQNTICFSTSALQEGDVLSVRYLTKDSTELRRSKDYILK
ncbi:MAG: sulfatase-like hydrolase/transferase, partial [Lachnospiraceae bacterium]